MKNIVIIEDRQDDIDILSKFIRRYEQENNEKFNLTVFRDGIDFLDNYKHVYDIVFMDIEMPMLDGMKTAHKLRELDWRVQIIFVTGLAQYAIKGYEVSATDYIVKPYDYKIFGHKFRRALARVPVKQDDFITLRTEGGMIVLHPEDLLYVEVSGHYLYYHTTNNVYRIRGSLQQISEQPFFVGRFSMCNKCYLVNLAAVRSVDGMNLSIGDEVLKISRPRKTKFMQEMTEYYAGGGDKQMNIDMFSFVKILFTAELFVGELLFYPYLHRRKHFWLRLLCGFVVCCLYAFFIPAKDRDIVNIIFIYASITLLSFVAFLIAFDEKIGNLIFVIVSSYTVQKIQSVLDSILSLIDPELFYHFNVFNPYWFALYIACIAITYPVFYFLFVRHLRECREGMLYLKRSALFWILPVAALINLVMGWLSTFYITGNTIAQLFDYTWNLIACILLLVIEYCILDRNRVEYDLEISQELIRQKEEQYRFSKENIELINRKCHDIKYIIRASAAGGAESPALKEAIEGVAIYDSTFKTGNETLDMLLTEKGLYCRGHNIEINCMADGQLLSAWENVDLYVLFGNLLDNAIRSTEKLKDVSARCIYLRISRSNQFVVVSVENRYEGEVKMVRGMPVSTKGNKDWHGYGLLGVKYLVEKYGGGLTIKTENHVFLVEMLFPFKVS